MSAENFVCWRKCTQGSHAKRKTKRIKDKKNYCVERKISAAAFMHAPTTFSSRIVIISSTSDILIMTLCMARIRLMFSPFWPMSLWWSLWWVMVYDRFDERKVDFFSSWELLDDIQNGGDRLVHPTFAFCLHPYQFRCGFPPRNLNTRSLCKALDLENFGTFILCK